jgi:hypothetical protein
MAARSKNPNGAASRTSEHARMDPAGMHLGAPCICVRVAPEDLGPALQPIVFVSYAASRQSPKAKTLETVERATSNGQRRTSNLENTRLRREYAANPNSMSAKDRARAEVLATRDERKRLEKANSVRKKAGSPSAAKPNYAAGSKKQAKKAQGEDDPAELSKLRSEVKMPALYDCSKIRILLAKNNRCCYGKCAHLPNLTSG